MDFSVTQWSRLKGKWLYGSSGKRWEVKYQRHEFGFLGDSADDLNKVADYIKKVFCKPVTGNRARLHSRKTTVTPSVEHKLSEDKSIVGMRSHYCFYTKAHCPHIYDRRYTCTACPQCKLLNFLECTNTTRGSWKKATIEFK